MVVIDPTRHEQAALAKAVAIAERFGSSLELYICDAEQDIPESWAGGARSAEYRELRRLRLLGELAGLAEPLKARGLDVTTACEWHVPLEHGIGQHAIRTRPDLVVKETHRHAPVPRASITRTDWNLVRQVPAPLLLVHPKPWSAAPRVAVAVDAHQSAPLDEAVLVEGRRLARVFGGAPEVYHVLREPPHLPGEPVALEQKAAARALAQETVGQVARSVEGVARFADGVAVEGLVDLVRRHGPDVLVVGAPARPHWPHAPASGTATQLLERLDCDLLVVKPPGFVSPLLVTGE